MAEATAIAQIDQDLKDSAPVWKDKLSGTWLDTGKQTRTIWTIDLDGGQLSFGMAGTGNSAPISFDHEDGKTVYLKVEGKAETRIDSFRFLDDDTVIWTNPGGETTLKRQ